MVGRVHCVISVYLILAVSTAVVRSQMNVSVKVVGAAYSAI